MPTKKDFVVLETENNLRLDVFLSEKLSITRSQAQKLIDDGRVLINRKMPKKAGDILKTGSSVSIQKNEIKEKKKEQVIEKVITSISEPKIIAETDEYLVIEKPTGMLTHPTMAEEKDTLMNWLVKRFPKIKKVGDDPEIRPGIVHRLDKEASGLLVVAKTQKMFDHLKNQFKNRTIQKEYFALVHGRVARDWEILNFPIARSENAERMAARPITKSEIEGEKEAKTEFIVEKRFVNFTLLRITLHTGRMHQIRVHFLAYNHPLVGDPLYFQKKRKKIWDERLGRLFLHSTKLAFTDLEGDIQSFESPLPEQLSCFLNELA